MGARLDRNEMTRAITQQRAKMAQSRKQQASAAKYAAEQRQMQRNRQSYEKAVAPKQAPVTPNRTHMSTDFGDVKSKALDIASTYGKKYGEAYARARLSK